MPVPIRGSVVVVTGASSGIGRATALEFARRGANVVRAVPSVVDVTDAEAAKRLTMLTADTFGRLDTWVSHTGPDRGRQAQYPPLRDRR